MKNLIILEGIASTGKTTIEKLLTERIQNSTIVTENEILMPLIDNKDARAAHQHLNEILERVISLDKQTIIFDRFHLTHAFRTNTDLKKFEKIEEYMLNNFKSLLVLLTIEEGVIQPRIIESQEIRGSRWAKGKQGSIEDKVSYYTDQQQKLKTLIAKSKLPALLLDTSKKEWKKCTQMILDRIQDGVAF